MSKYHVNPKTGNPGACKAQANCPFGAEEDHFETRESARKSYEQKQEKIEQFLFKTKLIPTKGSHVLATYDPMSPEVPVGQLWGNEVYGKFAEKLKSAPKGSRVVIENGMILTKENPEFYGEESWKLESNDYDNLTTLEVGRVYDVSSHASAIMQYGARLEIGGEAPELDTKHRLDYYPTEKELDNEANKIRKEFLLAEGTAAPDVESLREYVEDYIVERWAGLEPQQWNPIRAEIYRRIGTPVNWGTEEKPLWVLSEF